MCRRSISLLPDRALKEIDPEAGGGAQPRFTVKASQVGILLHRHPIQQAPLAPSGSRIRAGQTVALLQIGALLLPIEAPRDATVAGLLVQHGALVGYGSEIIELSSDDRENGNEH